MSSSGGQPGTLIDTSGSVATGTNLPATLTMVDDNGAARSLSSMRPLGDGTNGGKVGAVGLFARAGAGFDMLRTPNTFKPVSTLAVGAEATIWTPAAGKKFRLMGLVLALSAATTLTLKDNTAGTTIFRLLLPAGGPGITVILGNGILSAAANNVLTATSGAAANLDGTVWGTEE